MIIESSHDLQEIREMWKLSRANTIAASYAAEVTIVKYSAAARSLFA
jgi:hypothetical protein